MKIKKVLILGVIFCIGICALYACENPEEEVSQKVHLGVIYYNQSDAFLSEMNVSLREQIKSHSNKKVEITATIMDAAGSQRTQNDQAKELIDMGCNVLLINLVDRADPSDIIDTAREHDVPIIFFNREPVMEDMMQWEKLYYVGANAKESGTMQGELVADMVWKDRQSIDRNRDGKIQYVVLEGEPGHQDSIIRTENAVNTIKSKGIELDKLSCQIANWNRAQAQNRMEQMIGQYYNQIELVISNNDDMALGAMDAYRKLNYTESALPVFFGIDGTDAGLEAVKAKKLAGTVYNDKEGQAETMIKLATALVTGEGTDEIEFTHDHSIYLPYAKVTSENVSEILKKER